jgi:N-acyl homoserine lactone hydrolase
VTHLHWDHCSGLQLFPKAKIIVQSKELKSASPFPPEVSQPYRLIDEVNFTVVSGDTEISEGIRAILTPGHTYGLQGVLVEGKTRTFFIASDTFPLFKNIESDPPIMSNTYVDLEQYQKSIKKIAELSSLVLPGHDLRVFEEEVYL